MRREDLVLINSRVQYLPSGIRIIVKAQGHSVNQNVEYSILRKAYYTKAARDKLALGIHRYAVGSLFLSVEDGFSCGSNSSLSPLLLQ